ncbi:MAG: murein hydrolase activator EnvC family protein [Actinomycetota bacterium]
MNADTKTELEAASAKLNELIDTIKDQAATLNALQSEANTLLADITEVETRIAATQAKIVAKQQEIRDATDELQATQEQLDQRAHVAYENGPASSLEFLLGASSLSDLADRVEFVNAAAQSDQDLIDQLTVRRTLLQTKQDEFEALRTDLRSQQAGLESQYEELEANLASAQETLDRLNADKAEAEDLVKELEAKRNREIEEARRLAEALEQQGHGGDSIDGVLEVCPVDPPRAYASTFGQPHHHPGWDHLHQGNDILAPYDTPIRAPFAGTAVDASNDTGGLSVKVFGSKGYVYNAHMSAIGTLGQVSAGAVIGYVGDSGNAQGASPHDHFEWHPGNGAAVDPYPYLNSVC